MDNVNSDSFAMIIQQYPYIKNYLSEQWLSYFQKKIPEQNIHITSQQIEECLKFLILSSLTSGEIPVNQKIDHIWHLFILETKAYAELCKKLPGEKIIHHTSEDFSVSAEKSTNKSSIESRESSKKNMEWLVSYVSNFGNFTEESIQYWPFAYACMQKLNLNISAFNEQLIKIFTNYKNRDLNK